MLTPTVGSVPSVMPLRWPASSMMPDTTATTRDSMRAMHRSKQRVVVGAVRLADREGVDGLSMRQLAGAVGAPASF